MDLEGSGLKLRRFDVVLVRLDPVEGSEIAKTRPSVVVSPNELAGVLKTVVVAPMTTSPRAWPFRVACRFRGTDGFVAVDQLRTIDKTRIVRTLGRLSVDAQARLLSTLQEFFAP